MNEHALNKLLEQLDAVDSDGDEEVCVVRRTTVKEVEKAIEDVSKSIREAREIIGACIASTISVYFTLAEVTYVPLTAVHRKMTGYVDTSRAIYRMPWNLAPPMTQRGTTYDEHLNGTHIDTLSIRDEYGAKK